MVSARYSCGVTCVQAHCVDFCGVCATCVVCVWCENRDAERRRKDAKRNASTELSKDELHKMHPDPSRLEGLLIANQVCLCLSAACKSAACKSVASACLCLPLLRFPLLPSPLSLRSLVGGCCSTCGTRSGAKLLRFNQQLLGAVVDEALRSQGPSGQKPPCRWLLKNCLKNCQQTTCTRTHTLALTSQHRG